MTRCAIGVLCAAISGLLQYLLWEYVSPNRFVLNYPAIIAASWLAGWVGGLTATGLAALNVNYFYMEPYYAFSTTGEDLLQLLVFGATGSVLTLMNVAMISRQRIILEQEKLAASLKASAMHFRSLVDASPAVVWTTAPGGTCTYLSKQWYELTGQVPDEGLGYGWLEATHPDDMARAERAFRDATAARQSFYVDYRLRHRDGQYRWAVDIANPHFDSDGNFLGLVGTVIDVHDRWMAEEQSKKALIDLELALDAGRLGVFDWDLVTGKATWTTRAEEIFGYEPGSFPGNYEGFISRVHPEDRDRTNAIVQDALKHRRDYVAEYRALWPNGEVRRVLSNGRGFYDGAGNAVRMTGTVLDVTEQVQARESLERLAADLQGAVRVRDEFLSIASHELKTPLTTLVLQCQLRRRALARGESYTPEQLQKWVEADHRQLTRIHRLIEDMLDISRIRTGKLELSRQRVELCDLVRDAVERFQPHATNTATGTCIDMRVRTCNEAWVDADAMRVEQVVTNLLSNAVKYGRGRPVHVEVDSVDGGRGRLRVIDHGLGISPEDQQRIFSRFERAVSANEVSGLGLGLAIARDIVEAHGGEIRVESEPGKGSTFTVELPLVAPPLTPRFEPSGPHLTA